MTKKSADLRLFYDVIIVRKLILIFGSTGQKHRVAMGFVVAGFGILIGGCGRSGGICENFCRAFAESVTLKNGKTYFYPDFDKIDWDVEETYHVKLMEDFTCDGSRECKLACDDELPDIDYVKNPKIRYELLCCKYVICFGSVGYDSADIRISQKDLEDFLQLFDDLVTEGRVDADSLGTYGNCCS
jgi:hypothetical protein